MSAKHPIHIVDMVPETPQRKSSLAPPKISTATVQPIRIESDDATLEEDQLSYTLEDLFVTAPNFDAESKAAENAGLSGEQMTVDELAEFDDWNTSNNFEDGFIALRNHILHKWQQNKKRFLPKHEALERISPNYKELATQLYEYLYRFGFINMGMLEDVNSIPPFTKVKKRILVLGAGMAGLTAALQLQSFGYEVTVIEARNRAGGRVFTDKSMGVSIDMGAMIVTGTTGNPVTMLCEQLGVKLHKIGDNGVLYDVNGQSIPKEMDEKAEQNFNFLLDNACALKASKDKKLLQFHAQLQSSLPLDMIKSDHTPSTTEIINSLSLGKALRFMTNEYNQSIKDQKGKDVERRLLLWHVANLEYGCGTDLDPVSLAHWDQDDQYELGGSHCFLPEGYGAVIDAMAAKLNVQYGHVVKLVEYGNSGVAVHTEPNPYTIVNPIQVDLLNSSNTTTKNETKASKSVFQADIVINTLPLGVLQSNAIQHNPPLPSWKQECIDRLGFGLLNKIALYFPCVFWTQKLDWFGNMHEDSETRGDFYLFWNMYPCVEEPVLVGLVAGLAAQDIENQNTKDILERVMKFLKRSFGNDIPEPEKIVITNWKKDSFAGGSYSFIRTGATGDDYDTLAKPIDNKLFFAGEATCRQHPATVLGACLTGLREAGKIDKLFNQPQQTTKKRKATFDPVQKTPVKRRKKAHRRHLSKRELDDDEYKEEEAPEDDDYFDDEDVKIVKPPQAARNMQSKKPTHTKHSPSLPSRINFKFPPPPKPVMPMMFFNSMAYYQQQPAANYYYNHMTTTAYYPPQPVMPFKPSSQPVKQHQQLPPLSPQLAMHHPHVSPQTPPSSPSTQLLLRQIQSQMYPKPPIQAKPQPNTTGGFHPFKKL